MAMYTHMPQRMQKPEDNSEVSSLLPPCAFELLDLAACAFAYWTISPAHLCDFFLKLLPFQPYTLSLTPPQTQAFFVHGEPCILQSLRL